MNFKLKTGYLIFGVVLLAAGCANTTLTPEGQNVRVVTSGKKLPAQCTLIDKVSAFDNNGSTQSYQSHQHLVRDELIILQNKTAELGANTLLVTKHQQTFNGKPKNDFVDQHWMTGNAYTCR
jgi:hypothetical protein